MRSVREYVKCSCGGWARIVRAEDRQHRDKIVCAQCGRVTIADNIPAGRRVELKEDEDDD
jgi:ribosomal protein L34E